MTEQEKPDGREDASVFPLDVADLRQRSITGATVTIASQLIRTILTGISAVELARLLSASDFGLLAIVAPVTGFLSLISNVGLFQAIVQNPIITDRQITSMFWTAFFLGLAATGLFVVSAPLLAWIYHDSRILPIMLALSLTVVLSSISSLQMALMNRLMSFIDISLIEVATLFAMTFTSIVLAWVGWGYWALVAGQIVSAVLATAYVWILSPWRPAQFFFSYSETKHLLKFGRNLSVSNVAVYLNTSVDNMIVGLVLGINALGIYDRAWKLAVLPLAQLVSPINRIALPALSRLTGDEARYRSYFKRMLQMMMLISGPGLIAAILTAPATVPALLGPRWHDMAPVFQWLCVGGLIAPINGAAFWLLVSQGRSKEQLKLSLVVISINICSYAIGIIWGLEGVVRTSALSVYVLQAPILLSGACRVGPVRIRDLAGYFLVPLIGTGITALVAFFTWTYCKPLGLIGIASLFVISYSVYCGLLLFTREGRQMLMQGWALVQSACSWPLKRRAVSF